MSDEPNNLTPGAPLAGGQGDGLPIELDAHHIRQHQRMLLRAIEHDWPIEHDRADVVATAREQLTDKRERVRNNGVRNFIAMSKNNLTRASLLLRLTEKEQNANAAARGQSGNSGALNSGSTVNVQVNNNVGIQVVAVDDWYGTAKRRDDESEAA